MTRYSETRRTNLLDGARDVDGDPVSVRRINGTVPQRWPHKVALSIGTAEIHEDGTVFYENEDDMDSHPATGSLIGGAFNFTIWDGRAESPVYTATVQLNGGAVSLKAEITQLRDDPSQTGRQSNRPLKVPGRDPMPRGMKIGETRKGQPIVTIGKAFEGDLEDWDFRNRMVVVGNNARIRRIANCIFGETQPMRLLTYLDVFTKGVVDLIEWCDFIGPYAFGGADKAIGVARVKGDGHQIEVPEIKMIRRCRFDGLSADAIKAMGSNSSGGQFIEHCYFGPCPYITGAPPGADPHADCITIVAGKNGVTIRQCYMEMRPDRANGPRANIAVNKIVNAVRIVRNRNTDFLVEFVDISECIFDRARDTESYAMNISGGGQPNLGPTFVHDVWISYRNNKPAGPYIAPRAVNLVQWSNVRDLDTDRMIPKPPTA